MQAGEPEPVMTRQNRPTMQAKSIEQVYQQISNRREAIATYYVKNPALRISDPATYARYQTELRALNKRLRTIRQCLVANPALAISVDAR